MTEKNEDIKPSWMKRFLWWCAGVDESLIIQCRHEWAKYASMGATILLTGVLASLSGGYALYTVFRNEDSLDMTALIPSIGFGILWGIIIFNLDRYIITSFTKSSEEHWAKRVGVDILHATPRIIVAVIIAITISKPIEVKIFEDRLKAQIQKNLEQAMADNIFEFNKMYQIENREESISRLTTANDSLRRELNKTSPKASKLDEEIIELKSQKKIASDNAEKERKQISAIKSDPKNNIYVTDTLGNKRFVGYTVEANKRITDHQGRRKRYNDDASSIGKTIEEKEEERKKAQDEYEQDLKNRIVNNDTILLLRQESLRNDIQIVDSNVKVANKVAEQSFTNNFVTQLEALGDLKKAGIKETDSDSVKEQKKKEARNFSIISLAITLLFLMIELTPILTKLIIRRGAYDALLDLENDKISKMVAVEKSISLAVDEERIKAEVKTNSQLMSNIASVQAELLETAIEEWRKAELEKIHANPTEYIKSNTKEG